MVTPKAVLDFWFRGADPLAPPPDEVAALWFRSTPALDAEVRERFGSSINAAIRGELDEWSVDAPGRLALILLLDQLPRNAFRGAAAAFSGDAAALRHSLDAIAEMQDLALPPLHRGFVYLPLEHAEDPAMQARCVALMTRAAAEAPPALAGLSRTWVAYAEQHQALIARFGRFPHRNEVLGRVSTPDELAYLAGGGETFGQGKTG